MGFTFFFRDSHTLQQAINRTLPEVEKEGRLKVWDAGCERGPELFTFMILLAESANPNLFGNTTIDATDIDELGTFEPTINNGVYPYEDLKRIPEEHFAKYFDKVDDSHYKVNYSLHSKVKFTKHDLLTLSPIGYNFNLIICKNVLLHFNQEQRIAVYKMFHQALAPGGIIVNEQTQKVPEELNNIFTKLTSDASVYQKI